MKPFWAKFKWDGSSCIKCGDSMHLRDECEWDEDEPFFNLCHDCKDEVLRELWDKFTKPTMADFFKNSALVSSLGLISERLKTQDNRLTAEPMFCLQILCRDIGYDASYSDKVCWVNSEQDEIIYDDDPDFKEPEGDGWDEFGYVDRWETVMVAFTEGGLNEYMACDGHNVKRRAFREQTRIFVESFYRCHEMIGIRKALMESSFAAL